VKRICETCRAFRKDGRAKGVHECRATPPHSMLAGMQQGALGQAVPVIVSAWPTVKEDNDCEMWRPGSQNKGG
jgi:hypothetical protein